MVLHDGMIKHGKDRLTLEREVRREVIGDLKKVYYRGRYRAALTWSRVGLNRSAALEPVIRAGMASNSVDMARRETRAGGKSTA